MCEENQVQALYQLTLLFPRHIQDFNLASYFSSVFLWLSLQMKSPTPIHFECLPCVTTPGISIVIDMWNRCILGLELVRMGESVNNEQINTLYIWIHLM